jgi:ADP-sugar diphosphatase
MLVILQPSDLHANSPEEKYVLLTIQPRVPAGSLAFLEIPAGMVDDSGTFAGAAAKEIQEELGLTISEGELVNLSELASLTKEEEAHGEKLPRAMFPSPGGSDESISIFLHERRVPRDTLSEWTGKLTGLREDGEKITLKLVKLQDMWRECARDGKTLAAWALYLGLKGEGKI